MTFFPPQIPVQVHFDALPARRAWFSARLLDLFISLPTAAVWMPLIALLWLLVRLDGGPGFYGQQRVGKDGHIFRMWKLRSMVTDAEARLTDMLEREPALAQEWHAAQKLNHDPRLTRIGRILRRYSLDELPQLWNVCRGEMSLIGPRPFMPCQKALYDAQRGSAAYYEVRPGIGGLWQVKARNSSDFVTRVRYDTAYVANRTLRGDIGLLLRSVTRLVIPTGM